MGLATVGKTGAVMTDWEGGDLKHSLFGWKSYLCGSRWMVLVPLGA